MPTPTSALSESIALAVREERARCAMIARNRGREQPGRICHDDAAQREADIIADEIETDPTPDTVEGLRSMAGVRWSELSAQVEKWRAVARAALEIAARSPSEALRAP